MEDVLLLVVTAAVFLQLVTLAAVIYFNWRKQTQDSLAVEQYVKLVREQQEHYARQLARTDAQQSHAENRMAIADAQQDRESKLLDRIDSLISRMEQKSE